MALQCRVQAFQSLSKIMDSQSTEIGSLLRDIRQGSSKAEELLMNAVYQELKRLAARRMRNERDNHTLQTTAVVHEAYLRLAAGGLQNINDRRHFFALAAHQMRSVLVDYARARAARKRGSGVVQIEFMEDHKKQSPLGMDVLEIDEALDRFQKEHDRPGRVVELKFFGGYTDEEIAEILEVALITVRRDWTFARAWLAQQLTNSGRARAWSEGKNP
jgi:RNA polymerase sigma factor (TIGR02999 family)